MHIVCPEFITNEFPCVITRAIFMIGCQNLISPLEIQGMSDDVRPMCGIGNVYQIVCIRVQVFTQSNSRLEQESIQFAPKKKYWLAFQAQLPILVCFKNWFGYCTKRTMIKENDIWIKEKIFFERSHEPIISLHGIDAMVTLQAGSVQKDGLTITLPQRP